MRPTERRFSFLTAGPIIRVTLSEDFDELPEMTAPLGVGHAYRSFDFLPAGIDAPPGEDLQLVNKLSARDGRVVELYERADPPRQWYLRWILSNGALYTHLREDEGPGLASEPLERLAIEERDGMPPFLLPEPPITIGVSARPGYREECVYRSDRSPRRVVVLNRPSFLSPGQTLRRPDTDHVVLRGGAAHGIEVTVHDEDLAGARGLMSTVVASIAEN